MKDSVIKYIILGLALAIFSAMVYMSIKEGFIIGPDGFEICSTLNNCATCSGSFGCTWCATDAKCVSDNSANAVCPRQALVSSPAGCGVAYSTDTSGTGLALPGNRVCSASNSCNSCLSIPGCFWCSTQNICTSSIDVYAKCPTDMRIYNSFSQCSLSALAPTRTLQQPTTGTTRGTTTSIADTSSPVTNASSIIPVLGLSRNSEGSFTSPSMQTVVQSLQSQGYSISNAASRRTISTAIKAEIDEVKAQKKEKLNSYVGNSVDYISDGASLAAIKEYDTRLLDLHDIFQYIQSLPLEGFKEGFAVSFETLKSANEHTKESLKTSGSSLQYLWLANLVAFGTIIYFISG